MKAQLLIQNRLRQKYLEMQVKNPRISVRGFAQSLRLPAGSISLLMLGKRRVSLKLAEKISLALAFDPLEKAALVREFQKDKKSKVKTSVQNPLSGKTKPAFRPEQLKLSADQFHVVKDWQHYAILNLVSLKGFEPSSAWIATRLNMDEGIIQQSIDRLFRIGLLEVAEDQKNWRKAFPRVTTSHDIKSLCLQHAHIQELDLAKDSVRDDPVHKRDVTSLTLPMLIKDLPEAKVEIQNFYNQFTERFAVQKLADEVYQIQIQLFPLSKNNKEKKI